MSQQYSTTTRAATKSTWPKPTTESLPVWKPYEPHSLAWMKQARKRYPSVARKLDELATLAAGDPFICYECYKVSHLADYYIRGDRNQTFRYCISCARGVRENGTAITKLQDIEDPAEERYNSKETVEFSDIEESRSPAIKYHPLFYVGSTFFCSVLLWVLVTSGLSFIHNTYEGLFYQSPPISQLDITIAGKPYHVVCQNLNGQVIAIVEPLNDMSHLHEYPIARTSEPGQVPLLSFDGISTLYIHVGDSIFPLNLSK